MTPEKEARPTVLALPGVRVPIVYDPRMVHPGATTWAYLDGRPSGPLVPTIHLREHNEGVLLHELLHVLIGSFPAISDISWGEPEHHPLVWHLTRGLAAYLDIDLPAVETTFEDDAASVTL